MHPVNRHNKWKLSFDAFSTWYSVCMLPMHSELSLFQSYCIYSTKMWLISKDKPLSMLSAWVIWVKPRNRIWICLSIVWRPLLFLCSTFSWHLNFSCVVVGLLHMLKWRFLWKLWHQADQGNMSDTIKMRQALFPFVRGEQIQKRLFICDILHRSRPILPECYWSNRLSSLLLLTRCL